MFQLAMCLFIFGCTKTTAPPSGADDTVPQAIDSTSVDSLATQELSRTDFSYFLFSQLPKDENAMISPFSIQTVLAMTYAGAKGETARQMELQHPAGLGAVTEFDELFHIGYEAIIECLISSAPDWSPTNRDSITLEREEEQ